MCCTLANLNLSGEKDDFLNHQIVIEYLAADSGRHGIGIAQGSLWTPDPRA